MARHTSITTNRIIDLCEMDDNLGICGACGEDAMGVEPDARKYICEYCEAPRVYGAQEWLLMTVA